MVFNLIHQFSIRNTACRQVYYFHFMLFHMSGQDSTRVIAGAVVQNVQDSHVTNSLASIDSFLPARRGLLPLKHDDSIGLVAHHRVVELAAAGNTFRDIIEFDVVFFGAVTTQTHTHSIQFTKIGKLGVVQQVCAIVHGEDYDLMALLTGGLRDPDDVVEMPIGVDQDAEFHCVLL
jgi:hypothetical protein